MNCNTINRIFLGLALIAAGVLFMLDRAGFITFDIGSLFRDYWPVLIIYFSAVGLVFQRKMNSGWIGSYFWNLVGIAVGFYFLGRNLGFIDLSFGELIPYVIPVALILFGVHMIFGPRGRAKRLDGFEKRNPEPEFVNEEIPDLGTPPTEPISNFDEQFEARFGRTTPERGAAAEAAHSRSHTEKPPVSKPLHEKHHSGFFGWSNDRVENRSGFITDIKIGQDYFELKPMNISLFIGDTVLDLTKARIPAGETKINVSSFIGDVKIYIPNDLDLEICVVSSSFLGDSNVLDRREGGLFRNLNLATPGYQEAEKRLRIHVSVFIGDLTVQRVG
jgi:lia operon protein LiaF